MRVFATASILVALVGLLLGGPAARAFSLGGKQPRSIRTMPRTKKKYLGAKAYLVKKDKNRDGKLSFREFSLGRGLFKRADRNKDHFVSLEELSALPRFQRLQPARHSRHRAGSHELEKETDGNGPEVRSAGRLNLNFGDGSGGRVARQIHPAEWSE